MPATSGASTPRPAAADFPNLERAQAEIAKALANAANARERFALALDAYVMAFDDERRHAEWVRRRPLADRERHRADAEEIARIRDWARGAVVDAVEAIADERVRAALAAAGK